MERCIIPTLVRVSVWQSAASSVGTLLGNIRNSPQAEAANSNVKFSLGLLPRKTNMPDHSLAACRQYKTFLEP